MAHIKAKIGDLEFEYEGEQKFIAGGLTKFVKEFVVAAADRVAVDTRTGTVGKAPRKEIAAVSTSSIAQKLGSKTGQDLAIAAAAQLLLVRKKEKFSPTELVTEMREAKSFYKKSYHSNLANYLKRLVAGGKFNHLGGNDYSLSAGEVVDLEPKLA